MVMDRSIASLICCQIFLLSNSYAQTEIGRSYVEAVRLNAESLQSYDVLIDFSRTDGPLKQVDDRIRLKVDYPHKRAILFRWSKSSITNSDGKTENAIQNYSCSLVGQSCSEFQYNRPPQISKSMEFGPTLENFAFPVVDRVGLEWFPPVKMYVGPAYGSNDERKRWWTSTRGDLGVAKHFEAPGESTLTIVSNSQKVKGMSHSDVYAYLSESFTPSSRTLTRHNESSTRNPNQVVKREIYKWGDFEGIHVPIEIVGDELIRVSGSPEERSEIVSFFWIAINTELPEAEFSVVMQTDPQQIVKQTSDSVRDQALEMKIISK